MKPLRSGMHLSMGLALVLPWTTSLRAEDDSVIPHAWPHVRYEQLKQHSPFALATPLSPKSQAQPGFAANWYVSGIGHLEGEDFVTIKARDLSTEFSLYGHESEPVNGVCLASVEWSDKIGKSVVIIKRGIETARLEFNEAEVMGPAKITAEVPAQKNLPPGGALKPALLNNNGQGISTSPAGAAPKSSSTQTPPIFNPNAARPPIGESRLRQTIIASPPHQ